MIGPRNRREAALDRVPKDARARLDAWASKERVPPNDPAWDVVSDIVKTFTETSESSRKEMIHAIRRAAEEASPVIAKSVSKQLRFRSSIKTWTIAGILQSAIILTTLIAGGKIGSITDYKEHAELNKKITDKKKTLQFLKKQTHGLRLHKYTNEPEFVYVELPDYPRNFCDGNPCVQIKTNIRME